MQLEKFLGARSDFVCGSVNISQPPSGGAHEVSGEAANDLAKLFQSNGINWLGHTLFRRNFGGVAFANACQASLLVDVASGPLSMNSTGALMRDFAKPT